jgi:RNA polymerase II subunit A C-terminal domain phosphatase
MNHAADGPTLSYEEAQRIERETANHLLKERRLSLIVDLDQTIVHATVDPTVGEWISEGEEWEARQQRRTERRKRREERERAKENNGDGEADGSGSSSSESESSSDGEDGDEVNPNWEALKDVKRFRLAHETFSPHPRKGKNKAVDPGCLYYIKPRCVLQCLSRSPWDDSLM